MKMRNGGRWFVLRAMRPPASCAVVSAGNEVGRLVAFPQPLDEVSRLMVHSIGTHLLYSCGARSMLLALDRSIYHDPTNSRTTSLNNPFSENRVEVNFPILVMSRILDQQRWMFPPDSQMLQSDQRRSFLPVPWNHRLPQLYLT